MIHNGAPEKHPCPLWERHSEQIIAAIVKVDAMHDGTARIVENLRHLQALSDIRDTLLSSATGRDHVPTRVLLVVLATLGAVIVGLVFVIVFLLTGEAMGWINGLHR